MRQRQLSGVIAAVALAAAGCGGSSPQGESGTPLPRGPAALRQLKVHAAQLLGGGVPAFYDRDAAIARATRAVGDATRPAFLLRSIVSCARMSLSRRLLPVLLALTSALLLLGGCGDEDSETGGGDAAEETAGGDRALEHIHGLGVNPADNALIIATHFGLFQVPEGEQEPVAVGESEQDVMGFSVIGADHFLGSGHPGAEQTDLPPNLGLIESQDGGKTWENVSLLGEADFHVLRAAGERVYGVNSADGMLMVSKNGGEDWEQRTPPGPVIDLAIDPEDSQHVVVSTDERLFESTDAGAGWRPLPETPAGLLAWPDADALYKVDAQGATSVSDDDARSWRETGASIGGQPVAFAGGGGNLYAALADARVMSSADGGASWQLRAAP